MSAKVILVSCTVALLAQSAFSQCATGLGAGCGLPGAYGASLGSYGGYGAGLGGCGGVASTGGGLPVASASPNAPFGVSLRSENAYEGTLSAGGNLPFLGTVGIEGVVPTAGAGAVSYGSGNGAVGITSEGPIGTGIFGAGLFPSAGPASFAGYGAGISGYGLGGLSSGCGCGCGARY